MKAGRSRVMGRSSVLGGPRVLMWPHHHGQTDCDAQLLPQTTTHCSTPSARDASTPSRSWDTFKRIRVRQGVVMITGIGDDHGEGLEHVSHGRRYVLYLPS